MFPTSIYLHSNSTQILAYKKKTKTWKNKHEKKTSSRSKKNTFILCNFSVPTLWCFQKKSNIFFYPEKVKKQASKVAHNRPNPFFSQSSLDLSPQPRIDFSYYEILGPDICSLICDSGSLEVYRNAFFLIFHFWNFWIASKNVLT